MRPSALALALGVFAGLLAPPALASKETLKFKNGEGRTVDDLHVRLSCAAEVSSSDPDFPTVDDGGTTIGLAGTEVESEEVVTVVLEHDCSPRPTVRRWWWTRGGQRVGEEKRRPADASGVHVAAPACEPPLCSVTVDAPEGRLTVLLPSDLARGDTISGTVTTVVAAGRHEREQLANASRLIGYVVSLDDDEAGTSDDVDGPSGVYSTVLGGAPRLRVWSGGGPAIAAATLPVRPPAEPGSAPPGFTAPPIVQAGDPLAVAGPFDGRLDTTSVEVAGGAAAVLAEGPRGTVVRLPDEALGPLEIVVAEGGETVTLPLRVVGVDLSAPKLDLGRGERTELTVEVSGLAGLDRPLPLRLVNLSPGVVTLEGGDAQDLTIEPTALPPGADRHRLVFPLTGLRDGGFAIEAKVGVQRWRSACDAAMAKEHRCQPGTCFCEVETTGGDWPDEIADCSCTDLDGNPKTWEWGQGFPPPVR